VQVWVEHRDFITDFLSDRVALAAYIYIRGEFTVEADRLEAAIAEAYQGLLLSDLDYHA
jgi:hypothetical protein